LNLGSLGQDNITRFGEYESTYFEGKWYTNVEMEQTSNRLPDYKVPKPVKIIDSLPKNLPGKLLRAELRKLEQEKTS
jgi:acyl-coenzyme A synthetase/AMP-(fatty) acid ligase